MTLILHVSGDSVRIFFPLLAAKAGCTRSMLLPTFPPLNGTVTATNFHIKGPQNHGNIFADSLSVGLAAAYTNSWFLYDENYRFALWFSGSAEEKDGGEESCSRIAHFFACNVTWRSRLWYLGWKVANSMGGCGNCHIICACALKGENSQLIRSFLFHPLFEVLVYVFKGPIETPACIT